MSFYGLFLISTVLLSALFLSSVYSQLAYSDTVTMSMAEASSAVRLSSYYNMSAYLGWSYSELNFTSRLDNFVLEGASSGYAVYIDGGGAWMFIPH
jgi:hypothetical protein